MEYIHGALVDNWGLQLVSSLIQNQAGQKSLSIKSEPVKALLHFLDLIVLNENIIYETGSSWAWEQKGALQDIHNFAIPVCATMNQGKVVVREDPMKSGGGKRDFALGFGEDITRQGVEFYLSISQALGIQYWPAPKRHEYIERTNKQAKDSFIFLIDNDVRSEISNIARQVSVKFDSLSPSMIPGFGAKILADCELPESIIKTAIQLREDKYCVAFREWSMEMDHNLESGNLKYIHNSLTDVRLLFEDMRKAYSVETKNESGVKIQIGLKPSVTMDGQLLGSISKKFRSKPLHITFMKKHMSSVLESASLLFQINRLFNS